jgi:hypothetical protein
MSYITLTDLPELNLSSLNTSEFLLVADTENSYKVSLNTLNQFLLQATGDSYQVLRNKIIDDVSNYVNANAIFYNAQSVQNIAKGTPVKLVSTNSDGIVIVDICSNPNDVSIGVANTDMVANVTSEVMVLGIMKNIDTSSYSEGSPLYVGNGGLISTEPSIGLIQFIGYVISVGVSGSILINNTNTAVEARSVHFDNSQSQLDTNNVQNAIVELESYSRNKKVLTTSRLLISSNKITLPYISEDTIDIAFVYPDNVSNVITEYTCSLGSDKITVNFDSNDNLNGHFATVKYLASTL